MENKNQVLIIPDLKGNNNEDDPNILQLTKEEKYDDTLNVVFYKYDLGVPGVSSLSWKEKWYYFWQILNEGVPYLSELSLTKEEAAKIVTSLKSLGIEPEGDVIDTNNLDEDYREFLSGCVCHSLCLTKYNERNEPSDIYLAGYTHGLNDNKRGMKLKYLKWVLFDQKIHGDAIILTKEDAIKFATILRNYSV